MQDITAPDYVEVLIDPFNKILWVTVDGICALRICEIKKSLTTEVIGKPTRQIFPKT